MTPNGQIAIPLDKAAIREPVFVGSGTHGSKPAPDLRAAIRERRPVERKRRTNAFLLDV